jgi:hypothetical protein
VGVKTSAAFSPLESFPTRGEEMWVMHSPPGEGVVRAKAEPGRALAAPDRRMAI